MEIKFLLFTHRLSVEVKIKNKFYIPTFMNAAQLKAIYVTEFHILFKVFSFVATKSLVENTKINGI